MDDREEDQRVEERGRENDVREKENDVRERKVEREQERG